MDIIKSSLRHQYRKRQILAAEAVLEYLTGLNIPLSKRLIDFFWQLYYFTDCCVFVSEGILYDTTETPSGFFPEVGIKKLHDDIIQLQFEANQTIADKTDLAWRACLLLLQFSITYGFVEYFKVIKNEKIELSLARNDAITCFKKLFINPDMVTKQLSEFAVDREIIWPLSPTNNEPISTGKIMDLGLMLQCTLPTELNAPEFEKKFEATVDQLRIEAEWSEDNRFLKACFETVHLFDLARQTLLFNQNYPLNTPLTNLIFLTKMHLQLVQNFWNDYELIFESEVSESNVDYIIDDEIHRIGVRPILNNEDASDELRWKFRYQADGAILTNWCLYWKQQELNDFYTLETAVVARNLLQRALQTDNANSGSLSVKMDNSILTATTDCWELTCLRDQYQDLVKHFDALFNQAESSLILADGDVQFSKVLPAINYEFDVFRSHLLGFLYGKSGELANHFSTYSTENINSYVQIYNLIGELIASNFRKLRCDERFNPWVINYILINYRKTLQPIFNCSRQSLIYIQSVVAEGDCDYLDDSAILKIQNAISDFSAQFGYPAYAFTNEGGAS